MKKHTASYYRNLSLRYAENPGFVGSFRPPRHKKSTTTGFVYKARPLSWWIIRMYQDEFDPSCERRHRLTREQKIVWQRIKYHGFVIQPKLLNCIPCFFLPKSKTNSKNIIVEIDTAMLRRAQQERDWGLQVRGFIVLRFSNSDVLNGLDRVLEVIKKVVKQHFLEQGFEVSTNINRQETQCSPMTVMSQHGNASA